MKKQLMAVLITLILASFACSVQNIQMETIETQTVTISEPLPGNTNETELVFKMTGGEFMLMPGADGLVEGTITYNVEQWEPEFTRSANYYEIKQVNPYRITGLPTGDIQNNWTLALTDAIPLNLSIEGGASDNTFEFSGLQLSRLNIVQGASDSTIRFGVPNPVLMDEFTFKTGASSASLYGLAHANFETMSVSCGAGDYTLDFGGALTHDTTVDIKAGISNLSIIIPPEMNVVVNNKGTVTNINTRGTWMVTDDTYTTTEDGFTLTINLNMAVGSVTLTHEE